MVSHGGFNARIWRSSVEVGDLVRYKSKTLVSPNPTDPVLKVRPGIEGTVSVVNLENGDRHGRFIKDLEVISESR